MWPFRKKILRFEVTYQLHFSALRRIHPCNQDMGVDFVNLGFASPMFGNKDLKRWVQGIKAIKDQGF